jgi:hypothetical protein
MCVFYHSGGFLSFLREREEGREGGMERERERENLKYVMCPRFFPFG